MNEIIKKKILKVKDFLLKRETIIKIIFISLNALNLCFYINSNCVLNTIILIILYLYISDTSNKEKLKLILIWLIFSITTFIGEAIIIYKTKGINYAYKKPDIFNVNVWLLTPYSIMVFSIILLNDYFNFIL
tara:strand:- start:242 stop:637 length:396 start_codon:yes stop_codon:yes gene_type:complete